MKLIKTTILSAALTGCMLLAGTAQAANYGDINATFNTIAPGFSDGVGGGVFNFQKNSGTTPFTFLNGPAGQFIAFCLDTSNNVGFGQTATWQVQDVTDAPIPGGPNGPGPMTAAKATDIAKLVGAVLGGSFSNAATAFIGTPAQANLLASAFQLAIWEIVNENASNAYDANADWVYGSSNAAVRLQANNYLALLSGATAATGLFSLTNGTVQDFLVQVVPIPAAAWLLGSGLLGLFGLARRKTAVATA